MNYPVWELALGSGLLVAIVSIVHVFVSHFAIGGGLFLVVTEIWAARTGNEALLEWLKRHTTFFLLLTVVFGALTGVGIWFTIGLVSPAATSSLIRTFVWGWAIEWVCFAVEIAAVILYFYGWNRLDRRTHVWIGWVYFISAYLSLVVINGILTFMLTPGAWTATGTFWDGFLNPTYLPSLLFRTAITIVLAGVYALVAASVQKDAALKTTIVRWSCRWVVAGFAVAPLGAFWYIGALPEQVWASAAGKMPTATRYADAIVYLAAATFVLSAATWFRPRWLNLGWSLLALLAAFGAMGSFEFIRESIRKPYVIYDYMFANSIYTRPTPGDAGLNVENLNRAGVLKTARWARHREVTDANRLAAGRELFVLQCRSCHTLDGYRGVGESILAKRWSRAKIEARLGSLDKMYNGVMPPFVGTKEERSALAAFLAHRYPVSAPTGPPVAPANIDAEKLYDTNCGECHDDEAEDSLFIWLKGKSVAETSDLMTRLDKVNEKMTPFEGSVAEREALARYLLEMEKEIEDE